MVVTLTGCSIITITDFTLYFFDQDYKVVRMSFFDRCSQILHNFFLFAENEWSIIFLLFVFYRLTKKQFALINVSETPTITRGAICLPMLVGLGTSFKKRGKGEKKKLVKKFQDPWLLFRQLAMVFVFLEMKKCAIFTLWILYCHYYLYFYHTYTSILLDRSPAFLTSDYFVRSYEIVRT